MSFNYQPSQAIIAKIKALEGFRAKAYKDGHDSHGNQLWSIGYGHQIQPNEKYLLTATITIADADKLFAGDMKWRVADINRNLKRAVSQNQFDAFFNQHYNYPKGALAVINAWNNNNTAVDTSAVFKKYVYSDGKIDDRLVERAKYNADLFTSSAPDAVNILDQKKN